MLKKANYIFIFTLIIFLFSCNNLNKKENNIANETQQEIDTTTVLIKYNNNLFTLPSPYQVTFSVKNTDMGFQRSLLNPADNVSNYVTNFSQALNIGIYGTDLGYLNIYDQIPDVISYFTVIKKLSQEIGLDDALQSEIIDRIEENINNQDSLLQLITSTYRQFDSYLKIINTPISFLLLIFK